MLFFYVYFPNTVTVIDVEHNLFQAYLWNQSLRRPVLWLPIDDYIWLSLVFHAQEYWIIYSRPHIHLHCQNKLVGYQFNIWQNLEIFASSIFVAALPNPFHLMNLLQTLVMGMKNQLLKIFPDKHPRTVASLAITTSFEVLLKNLGFVFSDS